MRESERERAVERAREKEREGDRVEGEEERMGTRTGVSGNGSDARETGDAVVLPPFTWDQRYVPRRPTVV